MSAFTARIERPPFYRGGSASKKDDWLLPIAPSEGARSGSNKSSSRPCATPDSFPFGRFRAEPNGQQRMVYRRIEFFAKTC